MQNILPRQDWTYDFRLQKYWFLLHCLIKMGKTLNPVRNCKIVFKFCSTKIRNTRFLCKKRGDFDAFCKFHDFFSFLKNGFKFKRWIILNFCKIKHIHLSFDDIALLWNGSKTRSILTKIRTLLSVNDRAAGT